MFVDFEAENFSTTIQQALEFAQNPRQWNKMGTADLARVMLIIQREGESITADINRLVRMDAQTAAQRVQEENSLLLELSKEFVAFVEKMISAYHPPIPAEVGPELEDERLANIETSASGAGDFWGSGERYLTIERYATAQRAREAWAVKFQYPGETIQREREVTARLGEALRRAKLVFEAAAVPESVGERKHVRRIHADRLALAHPEEFAEAMTTGKFEVVDNESALAG